MSLTNSVQKILEQIESLNIPEGDYLSISNELKIVFDGIKRLEKYEENNGWGNQATPWFPLPTPISGWDDEFSNRDRADAFEGEIYYQNYPNLYVISEPESTVDDLPELISDNENEIDQEDLHLVLDQTSHLNTSREQAILALRNNAFDPYDAIFDIRESAMV